MRWILTAAAVFGFMIAIAARSPGWMAFGVVLALVGGIGAALAFIDLQIRASSRSEYMSQGELEAVKASLKSTAPAADAGRLPPPTPQ
jgi:hypothetical protein